MPVSRLISPFVFVVSRVDVAATQLPPAGTTFDSGFDTLFRRPRSLPDGDEQVGQSALIYLPPVEIRAQVEEPVLQRGRGQGVGGETEDGRLEVTALTADLIDQGLLVDGEVLLRRGDRLDEVRQEDGTLAVDVLSGFDRPLYVLTAELDGYGGLRMSNPRVGLVDIVFSTRQVTR